MRCRGASLGLYVGNLKVFLGVLEPVLGILGLYVGNLHVLHGTLRLYIGNLQVLWGCVGACLGCILASYRSYWVCSSQF